MTDERCDNSWPCWAIKAGYIKVDNDEGTQERFRLLLEFNKPPPITWADVWGNAPLLLSRDCAPGEDRGVASSSSPGGTEAELLKTLTYLSDEILVTLPLAESFFRQVWGDTNFDIVMMRAHEAHDLIAKLTEPHHD